MKNKKSGFVGKVKVALVLAGTVAFSALIIQCNAVVDQQEMIDTEKSSTLASQNEINLPVIPNENNHEAHDVTQSLSFEISNNALTIDGKSHTVAEVKAAVEESGLPREGIIVMIIDENQKMGLVYEVSREIQKAKRRKILYMGTDVDGNSTEIAMLLPPIPGYTDAGDPILAKIDEAHIAKYDLELLTFHVGKDHSVENQNQVYDFLKDQVARNRSNYVICVKYEDEDTYGQYLTNLYFVNQGFNLIYQERAQELFGKDLFSLDKVDYTAARKGIPRAISIADMETDR